MTQPFRAHGTSAAGAPSSPSSAPPGERSGDQPVRDTGTRPGEHVVTLIGKPGCHLCEDARKVIVEVCAELGATWEERDITQDAELHRKYWEQIPVVLVDGAQHDFWRVDRGRLRRALGDPSVLD